MLVVNYLLYQIILLRKGPTEFAWDNFFFASAVFVNEWAVI